LDRKNKEDLKKWIKMEKLQNFAHIDIFRDFLLDVEPIRFREPFAETLGVFKKEHAVLEYTFIDVVKLAGHACPTTAGAYLCCQEAIKKLYPDDIPVRGEISITAYGEPDEGVYGVISQVFTLLTGAAPATGFRGLGHKFKRKDLLKFSQKKIDPRALCFKFRRLENKKTVTVSFYPHKVPFPEGKVKRLGELLEKVVWEAAKKNEIREFQDLWMGKVRDMIIKRKDISEWIKIDEGEQSNE
jgi:DNA-binding HxlR family transcriptional regulator